MSNEIAEKLAQAVNDNESAESAAVQKGLEESAVAGETKQSAGLEKTTSQKAQKQSQAVPYDRFQEQNAALKEALGRITEVSDENTELKVKLAQLETDHDVVERIRGLAGDDRYRGLIETLDKALRGIHEEVQSGDKTKAEATVDTKKLLDDYKVQIEDANAQLRADLLWQQAKSLSDKMLDALGEDYDEQEKLVIARTWNPTVNWDAIEENPDIMQAELARSLKDVLEAYGEPRGALKAKVQQFETQQSEKTTESAKPQVSSEEALKGILDRDWGKVKTNQDGKAIGAEYSDDDFKNALARVIRMNQNR